MDKIMELYLAKANAPGSEAYATLSLPATPYELFDALDKVRLGHGDELYFEVSEYLAFDYLEPFLTESCSLTELNALTQKLSELDDEHAAVFEGLLKMEAGESNSPLPMGKLIDLAHSTDCCHVAEALSDAQLGRFYAENSFLPELDALPDSVFEKLDFAKIGKEQRETEGGVFTQRGYVVRHSELKEAYKSMDFTMRTPDYQILLELPDGKQLRLPCNALPGEKPYHCLDCRIPQIRPSLDTFASIKTLNAFAQTLKAMGDKPMQKYKAVLCAMEGAGREELFELAEHLDEFQFEGKISNKRELALDELEVILCKEDAALLAKYIDLYAYGQALLERDCSAITPYGLVEREDHRPLHTPLLQNGMELM